MADIREPTKPPRPTGSPWEYILSYEAGLDFNLDTLVNLANSDRRSIGSSIKTVTDLRNTVERAAKFIGDDLHFRNSLKD